ncbi:AbrB/MazE/SpoVT family DNA-binding domain-containing protein [Oryzibacter oryziterrae]|uniref:AbrB/MazE/SpoVT family DNA-binding domain-containing protein n=1 Tax=Oryzibacter oryziterrae TaxID=2766474 RepID=UPI001F16BC91|nr:AbrB/MazE/SpoVT family DNA-binding domain-containing protein [Oryzibacter oryziterrae]
MGKHEVLRLDAKSSSKGQVTIPAEIRQMIGLEPGGSVQFVTDGEGGVRIVAKRKDISHLFGLLGPIDGPIDVDEAIEEAVWARNRPDRTEYDV